MNSSKNFGRKALFVAVSAMALSVGGNVFAATDNLGISAEVVNNCLISAGSVDFGNYDAISANATTPLDNTGTVSVTCTSGAAAQITLGQGANADTGSSDAAPLRRMKDAGTNHLSYALFSDTNRETVWGNTAAVDVETVGTGSNEDHTVFGRVAAGQNSVPAGTYTDTVVATVAF